LHTSSRDVLHLVHRPEFLSTLILIPESVKGTMMRRWIRLGLVATMGACVAPAILASPVGFRITNQAGVAASTDPDLVNAWGIVASGTSPFWISANGTGKSVLYNGAGRKLGLVVTNSGGRVRHWRRVCQCCRVV
jgi:hypothetical protein